MKKATVVHVKPFRDGWGVYKINPKRDQMMGAYYPKWGETKTDAVTAAVNYAKTHQPSQVLVHRRDGSFQRQMDFGS